MSNKDFMFDAEMIEQLTRDFQDAVENDDGQLHILPTRASIKRQFAHLDDAAMMEVQDALEKLEEQLGNTDTKIRHLSTNDVETLVDELLAVRKVGDILSSREDTLKAFAKDIISLDQIDPDKTSGEIVSSKHRIKISKEIRGGKPQIDVDRLKKRLTPAQFSSVTNKVTTTVETTTPDGKMDEEITITYTVNEKFLEAEMVKGNILSEDVFLSTVETKRTSAIYIRNLDE